MYEGQIYFIFESAATKYSRGRGVRCKYPVDRVCAFKTEDLLNWTTYSYVNEKIILEQEETETAADMGGQVSTAREAKTIPTYIKMGTGHNVQMLYNPYTAQMLFNMIQDMGHIREGLTVGKAGWNDTMSKNGYGNLQVFRHASLAMDDTHTAPIEVVTGISREAAYNNQEKFNIVIGIAAVDESELVRELDKFNYVYEEGIMQVFMENAKTLYNRLAQISYDVPDITEIDGKKIIQYTPIKFADILGEMQHEGSRYTVTITGAGIGGGIADILTGILFRQVGIYEGNVNCYTFGAVAVAKKNLYMGSNIFNIVNADDFAPKLQGGTPWGGIVTYQAKEEFRRQYYGAEAGRELKELGHSMTLYKAMLDGMEENISAYIPHNVRNLDDDYQTITIDKNCFADFQNLNIQNTIEVLQGACLFVTRTLHSGTLRVKGELKVHGQLRAKYVYIENGIVSVDGSCVMAYEEYGFSGYLEITGSGGILEINGSMDIPYFNYTAKTGEHIKLYGDTSMQ